MYWQSMIIIFSPLVGAITLLFKNKSTNFLSSIIANSAIGISMLLSSWLFISYLSGHNISESHLIYTWYATSGYFFEIGLLIDSLTIVMAFIVTFISFFVHMYSIAYMKGDPSFKRFFIYTNFFTFSMLFIIFSNNFLQLFIGWELVGLSSYLLIGFWYNKPSAVSANLKAFVVNRVGDIGLLLGVILILITSNSLNYADFFEKLPLLKDSTVNFLGYDIELLPFIALLLFIGAAAKSAQIPLHFWLPDSMEGPTPISALIHAATMVTAGIFMVARLSPLYDLSGYVLDLILVVGVSTALLMGMVALVQNDIKRIIAYSTISQLGYMTAALGASYYSFAIYHLLTHAFFKALLFLCAGSIILKCHHEQDITKMGGLRKIMPITFITFFIAGISLMGVPSMSGFFSKDLIIDIFKYNNNSFVYYSLVLGVFITTLYTSKIFIKVFLGNNQLKIKKKLDLEHSDTLIIPLLVLAIPSAFIGWALFDGALFNGFFDKSITDYARLDQFYILHVEHSVSFFLHSLASLSFVMIIFGMIASYFLYYKNNNLLEKISDQVPFLRNMLLNEYGFTTLSNKIIPTYFKRLANMIWMKSDVNIIDNFFVNGTANLINFISSKARLMQTGYLYHYAFTMIIGLLLFLIIFYDF
jgi:NADH-quinone oxidoreductase subunit L